MRFDWRGPGSQLARLQASLVVLAALCALGWMEWAHGAGLGSACLLLGLSLAVLPHAWVLGVEMTLLAWHQRRGGAAAQPLPGALQLLRAWAGEVLTGLRVFAWNQPFCHRLIPDQLPANPNGQTGVLLIHGFVCNRGLWNPWMRRLRQAGVPFVALSLEPVFGSIDDYVQAIEAGVARLEAATGRAPLVVAHSMGGLALRAWLRSAADGRGNDARIAHAITLASPHHGTHLARWGMSRNARQMGLNSRWLAQLRADEARGAAQRFARFSCHYTDCDNIVYPVLTATLAGAANHLHRGVAHLRLVFTAAVWADVQQRLRSPG